MGDILGDLNTRRAQVQGMQQDRGNGVITALVPLAEISVTPPTFAHDQGRGIYTMEFSHYDVVPGHLVDKIREEAEKQRQQE